MSRVVCIITLLTLLVAMASSQTQCSLHCTQCQTSISCSQCQLGFFLVNRTFCAPCPTGCTNCSIGANNLPICYSCAAPAQLDQTVGRCYLCNPMCLSCANNENNCVTCRDGQTLQVINGTGVCRSLVNCTVGNCAECSFMNFSNYTFCNRCLPGYFEFRQECFPCKFPCATCLLDRESIWINEIAPHWTMSVSQAYFGNSTSFDPTTNSSGFDPTTNSSGFDPTTNSSGFDPTTNSSGFDPTTNSSGFDPTTNSSSFDPTTNSSFPGLNLPQFINNMDFLGMQPRLKRGWTEAYFVYKFAVPIITSRTNISESELILMGISLYSSIQNLTLIQKRAIYLNRLNQIGGMNITQSQLRIKLGMTAADLSNCSQCSRGYQLNRTIIPSNCAVCAPGCLACSNSICSICQDGLYLLQGSCVGCLPPCLSCTSRTNCTKCPAPLTLSSGACVLCVQPCATCSLNDSSACITCIRPFSLNPNSTGSCYRCDQDLCNECQPTNTSICINCRIGATLTDGKCSLCPAYCQSCLIGALVPTCFVCQSGFLLGADGRCYSCSPGCLRCSSTNTSICMQCQAGTFLNTTSSRCQRCKQGCSLCTSYEVCTLPQQGQVQIANEIVKCRPGCKYCSPIDSAICTQCQLRYFLSGSFCFACSSGCQICTSNTTCTKCVNNLNLVTGICVECSGNCRTCSTSNSSQCLSCKRGFALVGTQCIYQCGNGCLQCDPTNSAICKVCKQGHTLKPDYTCVKCLQSCRGICDSRNITTCLSCLDGFELKQNKCVRCPQGCATCLNSQCLTCVFGYSFSQSSTGSFVCRPSCKYPCLQCTQTSCTKCSAGYTMNASGLCQPRFSCNPICDFCPPGTERDSVTNECIACPMGCGACQSGVCVQCIDGSYKNLSGVCVPCSAQCKTCFDNSRCKQCSSGFVKQVISMISGVQDATYSDKCIACSQNCKTCVVEPERCTSCHDGYRLFFYRCANMFNVIYRFEININFTLFLETSESQRFIETLANLTRRNISDIYITDLRSGSTVISGSVSTQTQQDAADLQQNIGPVPGYAVISSSAEIYYGDDLLQDKKEQQQKSNVPLGAIIGGSVGAVVLIALTIFVVYKIKSKSIQILPKPETKLPESNLNNVTEQNIQYDQRYETKMHFND